MQKPQPETLSRSQDKADRAHAAKVTVPMSAFGGTADIEAGSVQRRDHGPRQRAIAALRAHS